MFSKFEKNFIVNKIKFNGKKSRGKFILCCANQGTTKDRFCFIRISSKFAKANKRNLFKRRIRYLFRTYITKEQTYLFVSAGKNIVKASYIDIKNDFLECCKKLKIL